MQIDIREQIFAAFYRNVLNLPVDGPEMTATEVIQRKEEFIREIGPVFGRMEVDDKAPTIERSFNILLRGGAFPKIPKVLSGQNVRFEYESPIKKIKEQIQAAAARQWALEQMEYATVDPTAIDVVNFEALGRFTHQAAGLPPEIINSAEAVQARAAARQQAQAQAMEMEALERGVGAANQGAEAMNKMMETA
jgi:hypothetical protein